MKNLFLLASYEQWTALRRAGLPDAGDVLASLDLDTLVEAEDAGLATVNLFAFQILDHAQRHERMAWAFCDNMAEALAGRYVYHGYDLLNQQKRDFAYPLMYVLNVADMVGQCLAAHSPTRVWVFPQHEKAFIWDPGHIPPDFFNAVARWVAEKAGFQVEPLTLSPIQPSSPIPVAVPLAKPINIPSGMGTSAGASRSCQVLSISSSLGLAEQSALLEQARKAGRQDWFVSADEPVSDLPWFYPFRSLRLPARASDLERALEQFTSEALPAIRARMDSGYEVILDNPHLGFFWTFVAGQIRLGAMSYAVGRLIGEALRPAVVLTGDYALGYARCLANGLRETGACCVAIQHGYVYSCLSNFQRYAGNPTHLAVWNDIEFRNIGKVKHPQAKLAVTGTFRSDLGELKGLPPAGERQGRVKVVLLSSWLAGLFTAAFSMDHHLKVQLALAQLCEKHPEWDFVVKMHPRYSYKVLYGSKSFRGLKNLSVVQGKPLEVLSDASVAVMVTDYSSVCLDAMAVQVPVVWLATAVKAVGNDPVDDGVLTVQSVDELESVLVRLLSDSSFRSGCVARGRAYLDLMLPFSGEAAVARLNDFLDELLAEQSKSGTAPRPAARWLVDLFGFLKRAQTGVGGLEDLRVSLAEHGCAGAGLDFSTLDYLDIPNLGACILGLAVLTPWRREDVDLPRVARQVYNSLPAAIRPSSSTLREYLVQAYVAQGRRRSGWRNRIMPYLLAPGRLRYLAGRGP